jgi:hypothetical protein
MIFRATKGDFASRLCIVQFRGKRNVEPLSISRDWILHYETISRHHLSRSKLDFASIHKIRRVATVSSHFVLDFRNLLLSQENRRDASLPASFRDYLPQISFQESRQAEDPAPAGGLFLSDLSVSVPHVPYRREICYSEGVESCGVEYIFREFKH